MVMTVVVMGMMMVVMMLLVRMKMRRLVMEWRLAAVGCRWASSAGCGGMQGHAQIGAPCR